jgi:hypothetical protein
MSNVVSLNKRRGSIPENAQIELFNHNPDKLPTIAIHNHDLIVREYRGERVVTFDVIDKLHIRPSGTARRNFNTNKKHFIEGVDYHVFKGESGRQALCDANYTNFVELPTSNNFNFYLFTQTGYLMLCKSFQDELAWVVQRQLVTAYFQKATPIVDIFSVMRQMIDALESNQKVIEKASHQIETVNSRVDDIDERMNITVHPSWLQANQIARSLGLFTISRNLPHAGLIASIARQLGFRTNVRTWYQDDDIAIISQQEDASVSWMVYYKPVGISKILDWWNNNKDAAYFVELYKRDTKYGKVGEPREAGYRIGGVKYIIKH